MAVVGGECDDGGVTGSHEPTDDDWKRLGKEIADRRFKLNLSQEALVKRGGPSHQIVRNVEKGLAADYRGTTFRKFDRSLWWRDGTTRKILLGTATQEEIDEVVRDQTIYPESIPSRSAVGEPTFTVHEKSGGAAATAHGTGTAHRPSVVTEDGELRFGPGQRIPRRDATIVTVAELLRRLREEDERTPTMGEAEDVLLRLLPELYGRDYPGISAAQRTAADELERRTREGDEQ